MAIPTETTDRQILAELGERLARRRLDWNLTQDQLAREAGVRAIAPRPTYCPSAWDGDVATVASATGVKAMGTCERGPIRLRERPSLYAP